ncbi:hypothetical protein DPMN_097688 [Dreissena polymorpha]|uniref:Uncharacterized protein n=1 Tax=Dreissena polymorpha TaxID=45954 RepID=A0A9D4LAQ0_DREPO|nr:hypothetical protein DPMN_096123 [Dreissena polymorpha]KAH3855127.1 hypothetical protein DPMN_097688 [Dreissena polymorpha]
MMICSSYVYTLSDAYILKRATKHPSYGRWSIWLFVDRSGDKSAFCIILLWKNPSDDQVTCCAHDGESFIAVVHLA